MLAAVQQSCGQALPAVGGGHCHVAAIEAPRLGCGKRSRQQLHTATTLLALTLERQDAVSCLKAPMVTFVSIYIVVLCMLCVCAQMLRVMSSDNLIQPAANIRTELRAASGRNEMSVQGGACNPKHSCKVA